jgi:hypothetical protein
MSTATVTSLRPPTILQIKIKLKGIQPPIWRTVLCKSDMTLEEFHSVIQDAMGWCESHAHMFKIGDERIGMLNPRNELIKDERKFTLEDVPLPRFEYWYDFGDNWYHDIQIVKEVPYDPNVSYPCCIKGKRACPLEDCGGIWGYQDIVDGYADGTISPSLKEWVEEDGAGPYDAERFDLAEVNKALRERNF